MAKRAKTEFLQIRLTPEDRDRIWRAAATAHLDPSTWARQVLLQAIDAADPDPENGARYAEYHG